MPCISVDISVHNSHAFLPQNPSSFPANAHISQEDIQLKFLYYY